MTLKHEIGLLKKKERDEIQAVRDKYRTAIRVLRHDCVHKFGKWAMPANPEFRYDFLGDPIWYRKCEFCEIEEMKKGDNPND